MAAKRATVREHKTYPQNVAPAWRNRMRADELPTLDKIRRPIDSTPRRAADWR